MRRKLYSIMIVLLFTLMACQGMDNNNTDRTTDHPNVDPTTFPGEGMFNTPYTYDDFDTNRYGRDGRMNNNRMDNNNRYDIAEEAAERITDEIDEIENAYVLTTENNAYVAANFDRERNDRNRVNRISNRNQNNRFGDDEVSDDIKRQIADIVRSVDRDIDNVYVSTNPDFLDLITNYANDVDRGRPVGGFFDQIGNMIDRLFPENMNDTNRVR